MWNRKPNVRMWFFSSCMITLLGIAVSLGHSCDNVKTNKCGCITLSDGLQLNCSLNAESEEEEDVLVHIVEDEQSMDLPEMIITIDCFRDMDYINILPSVSVPKVKLLMLSSCPLLKSGFHTLLNRFNITELQQFDYSYDLRNITVTKDYFAGLELVTKVKFFNDNLTSLDENVFQNFPNLEYLDLEYNNISLTSELFRPLQKLKWLCFTSNNAEYIPDNVFQNLKELEILEMWSNNLVELNKNSFTGLDNLISLELTSNQISSIEENTFDNLVKLEKISLNHNKIEFLPKDVFSKNKQLTLIRLMDNQLKNFSDYQFSNLSKLAEISLSSLLIEEIPENIFWLSSNLKIVDLSQNRLHEIPKALFRDASSLKKLDLHANNLQYISDEVFENLNKLEYLYLHHNFLTEISETLFFNLRNIIELDLSNNNISKIHYNSFHENQQLQTLLLSYNNLYTEPTYDIFGSPFSRLSDELRTLNLSHNVMSDMDFNELIRLKKRLRILDVSYNNFNKIEITEFIPTYTEFNLLIDLSYNNIEEVSFALRLINEALPSKSEADQGLMRTKISLSHNPIKCDCEAVNLRKYFQGELDERLKKTVIISSNDLVCALPRDLQNKNITDVPIDKFVCPCNISEDCSCFRRGFDNSFVASCAERGLSHYPNISLPRYYNKIEIDLSNNSLTKLFKRADYENVTTLILSNNHIDNVTWIPPHIEVLKLDSNRLKKLDTHILKTFSESLTLTNLTLYDNPWTCDCSSKSFIDFLRHSYRKVDNVTFIKCREDRKTIVSLSERQLCYNSKEHLFIAVIVIFLAVVIFMSLAGVCYMYRREIRLYLYRRNLCIGLITQEDLDKDKEFDAFVSYSNSDQAVVEKIALYLENYSQPYKLCLHYRDWVPGRSIPEQIIDSVNNSKRTVIILSNNFLESIWAKMEFQTAHLQAMKEKTIKLIIVLYGDLNMEALDEELKLYLKTNTYVKWGDPYFWDKLRLALPHKDRKQKKSQREENTKMAIQNELTVPLHSATNGLKSNNQELKLIRA